MSTQNNNDFYFSALLKSENGHILAEGKGSVSIENRCVNFISDFVPLYPIGTPMQIVRVYEGSEIHRFRGKVYLSDKQLMRIVSVEDELLPGFEKAIHTKMDFEARLIPLELPPAKVPFRFWGDQAKTPIIKQIIVNKLTQTHVDFTGELQDPLKKGQRFYLDLEPHLPLKGAVIEIEKALLFGKQASYIGGFSDLNESNAQILRDFLAQYNQECRKFF